MRIAISAWAPIIALALAAGACAAADKPAGGAEPAPAPGKAAAAEPQEPAQANGVKPLEHYEAVITKNPFSPKLYQKPDPPKEEKAPPPKRKVVTPQDNLRLTGVVFDKASNRYSAMIEVSGATDLFLSEGGVCGKIKVDSVTVNGIEITDHEGKKQGISLGQSFHDGIAVKEEWIGGAPPGSGTEAKAEAPGAAPPAAPSEMSKEKEKEILDKLRAKRQASQK